jgi:hypothetical protein
MNVIYLTGGGSIETEETQEDLRHKLSGGDRLVTIKGKDGYDWDINPDHVVGVTPKRPPGKLIGW